MDYSKAGLDRNITERLTGLVHRWLRDRGLVATTAKRWRESLLEANVKKLIPYIPVALQLTWESGEL